MDHSLRARAMERMEQLYGTASTPSASSAPSAAPDAPEIAASAPPPPSSDSSENSIQTPLLAFMKGLGLDRDRLILLLTLIVLYYDHASPKILLAVLYLML